MGELLLACSKKEFITFLMIVLDRCWWERNTLPGELSIGGYFSYCFFFWMGLGVHGERNFSCNSECNLRLVTFEQGNVVEVCCKSKQAK